MYFVLNGIIGFGLACYFSLWMFGGKTSAKVIAPYGGTNVTAAYVIDDKTYTGTYMRNDIAYTEKTVEISYLRFAPSFSRINSFMGIAAEPLGWWLIFLIASTMLFFTDNMVFSKGTIFVIHRKFPWIYMEEYFRMPWFRSSSRNSEPTGRSTKPVLKTLDERK